MSQYPNPSPSSSNGKMLEYVQDLPNEKSLLVRKTPLKPRCLRPPKQIRKRKVALQTCFTELISTETTPNEHSEVKDVYETSNIPPIDCQDIDPRSTSQDPIVDTDPRPTIQDPIEDTGPKPTSQDPTEGIGLRPSSQDPIEDVCPRPTSQDQIQDTGPNRDTKDSEIEGIDVQKDVNGNSESNVEDGHSSGGDALVNIVDDPPEKNIYLEISQTFVIIFLTFLKEELSQKGDEGSINLGKARDILKDALTISKDHFKVASPQLSLAIPDELENLNEEREQLLEEVLELIQKTSEIVKKYRELFSDRLSEYHEDEEIEEEWDEEESEEEHDGRHKDERDGNRYSFPTFLANYLLFVAIILIFILPAIVFQNLEHPNPNGFIHAIVSWFNSTSVDHQVAK